MTSNLKFAVLEKNALLDSITSQVGASGLVALYTGTQPTNPDTALSGNTLLSSHACSATFAPASSGGVLTANAISNAFAGNTGTATWGSVTTSGGVRKVDFSVGTSGADLNLSSVIFSLGATVTISSLTLTAGN